jgi:hypothetical protein
MHNITFFLLFFSTLFLSCSSSGQKNEQQKIEADIIELNTWLNLMPGRPGQFFLQGEIVVKNLSDESFDVISVENIKVYAKEELIFNFIPILEVKDQKDDLILEPHSSKEFRFRTDGGIRLGSIEIPEDKIDVKFSVTAGIYKYDFELNDINVERAY